MIEDMREHTDGAADLNSSGPGLRWLALAACLFAGQAILYGAQTLSWTLDVRGAFAEHGWKWQFGVSWAVSVALVVTLVFAARTLPRRADRRLAWMLFASEMIGLGFAIPSVLNVVFGIEVRDLLPTGLRHVSIGLSAANWALFFTLGARLLGVRVGTLIVAGLAVAANAVLWMSGMYSSTAFSVAGLCSAVAGVALLRAFTPRVVAGPSLLPAEPWRHVSRGLVVVMYALLARALFAVLAAVIGSAMGARSAAMYSDPWLYTGTPQPQYGVVVLVGGGGIVLSLVLARGLWSCARAPLASGARMGFAGAAVLAVLAAVLDIAAVEIALRFGGRLVDLSQQVTAVIGGVSSLLMWTALYRLIAYIEPGQAGTKIWRVFAPLVIGLGFVVVGSILTIGASSIAVGVLFLLPAAVAALWSLVRMLRLLRELSDTIESRIGVPAAHLD